MRIRYFIALMVTAIMLPLLVASATAIHRIWQEEHKSAMATLLNTADALALQVDKDLAASISAMQSLSASEHLVTGNLEAFYRQAKAINRTPDTWSALLNPDGTQVLNTSMPFESPPDALPSAETQSRVAHVLATQKPWVSNVYLGQRSGRRIVGVYVPSEASGRKKYVLVQALTLEHWKDFGQGPKGLQNIANTSDNSNQANIRNIPQNAPQNVPQNFAKDLIVVLVDRAGQIIARSHNRDQFVGQPARQDFLAAAAENKMGFIRTQTLDGIDSYVSFDHSDLTGWTIGVAGPAAAINAPVVRALQIVIGGFLLAVLASVALATAFGRRFVMALQTSSQAAMSLGQGQTPPPVRTPIAEVTGLNQSLANAGAVLEQERTARLAAEQAGQQLLQNERLAHLAAEKESKAKDRFMAMLGHELRNPLAAISGAVAVLTRSAKGTLGADPTDRYLGIIRRQNRHLVHIIDDLLDMSRLIAGKIVLERHPVNLAESLQSCVDGLKAAQRDSTHTLTITADPVWVNADPVRIEQILINLIGNALKFSKVGATIEVELHALGELAVLTVQDHGTGMSPELLAQVFEPFVQGPAPVVGTQSGMGIGLALVKQLVELHGGTVAVASAGKDQGSTFTIHLPAVARPSSEATSGFSPLMAARPRTLLYVEDNADAREVMSEILRMAGYTVIEAATGAQALQAVAAQQPDGVVLDIGLPDMNGYEVARQIRQLPHCHDMPILALTGYGQSRDMDASLQFGFNAHLVKPVDPEDLTRALETVLAGRP